MRKECVLIINWMSLKYWQTLPHWPCRVQWLSPQRGGRRTEWNIKRRTANPEVLHSSKIAAAHCFVLGTCHFLTPIILWNILIVLFHYHCPSCQILSMNAVSFLYISVLGTCIIHLSARAEILFQRINILFSSFIFRSY